MLPLTAETTLTKRTTLSSSGSPIRRNGVCPVHFSYISAKHLNISLWYENLLHSTHHQRWVCVRDCFYHIRRHVSWTAEQLHHIFRPRIGQKKSYLGALTRMLVGAHSTARDAANCLTAFKLSGQSAATPRGSHQPFTCFRRVVWRLGLSQCRSVPSKMY